MIALLLRMLFPAPLTQPPMPELLPMPRLVGHPPVTGVVVPAGKALDEVIEEAMKRTRSRTTKLLGPLKVPLLDD